MTRRQGEQEEKEGSQEEEEREDRWTLDTSTVHQYQYVLSKGGRESNRVTERER